MITDIFPWQHSGVEVKRSWPIGPEVDVLKARWAALVNAKEKDVFFKETRDRKVNLTYPSLFAGEPDLPPLESAKETDFRPPVRYGFRTFDRQYLIPDNRIGDYFRPSLWHAHSEKQIYISCLFNHPLGMGPALTACAYIPDRHHYRGSYGGKDIIPLYRDPAAREPNIAPGLLDTLSAEFGKPVAAEDLAGYVYGVLAQPEYTSRFARELGSREIRFPLTRKEGLFFRAAEFGKSLLWLHTYGGRLVSEGRLHGAVPLGKAKCLKAVPDEEDKYPNDFVYNEESKKLQVGEGIFGPVTPEVYNFEVSGFHVVKSWLGYRMRERSGRKSSPLDDIRPRVWTREFTRELLELLWVLEKTVEGYPRQKKLFEEILAGPLLQANELPPVPDEAREAPHVPRRTSGDQGKFSFDSEQS